MSRILPSQVVTIIDKFFPDNRKDESEELQYWQIESAFSGHLAAILNMVDRIPSELITLEGENYAKYIIAVSVIRNKIEIWKSQPGEHPLKGFGKFNRLSPITLLRQALELCPDEFPAASTSELVFIGDSDFKENLRIDISAVDRALANGEWKAATILAGSVIEALLLWALSSPKTDSTKLSEVLSNLKFNKNLNELGLCQLVEVTKYLKIIKEETAKQIDLARDFRNLIHPGRSERLAQKCNRGTAMSAVAALELVIGDLTS
jgi:hypothetical protein